MSCCKFLHRYSCHPHWVKQALITKRNNLSTASHRAQELTRGNGKLVQKGVIITEKALILLLTEMEKKETENMKS